MAETCDGLCDPKSPCDPSHPWHCCHFALKVAVLVNNQRRAAIRCVKCGKMSRTTVPLRRPPEDPEGPTI